MTSDSRDNPYCLFFRCRSKNCKFFEWWSFEANNSYFEENIEGITIDIWGHDDSSRNVGESGDGLSRSGARKEENDVKVVLVGFRGLRTTVTMLFVVVVILVIVIVIK